MHINRTLVMATLLATATFFTPARAETVNLTFLLTNDIYNVENDTDRGGFARLNAVVKAERAKGGTVIYAHAGDLISPALLSGLDLGEHTIALTNLAPPDIFTPGNHEFDFGEQVFRKRMSEAKFPLFAANLRDRNGQPLPGFKDTEIRNFGGLKVGFVGLLADDSAVKSNPGSNLVFTPTFETALAKAKELKAAGADMIVAVAHAKREVDLRLYESGAFDIILSGDDHDLALLYDGHTVLAESMTEANYVTAIDVKADVTEKDGKRRVTWWPDFRVIDTVKNLATQDFGIKTHSKFLKALFPLNENGLHSRLIPRHAIPSHQVDGTSGAHGLIVTSGLVKMRRRCACNQAQSGAAKSHLVRNL